MRTHYETPGALRHDAHTLADDTRALLTATANMADEKVVAARRRVEAAIANGRDLLDRAQEQTQRHLQAADHQVRRYPYESIGIAFGIGAVLGYIFRRR